MTLKSRVLAAVAAVAVVLALVMGFITRSTRANLLQQVDSQLAAAVGPVRSYGLLSDAPGGRREGGLTSLFVGYLDGAVVRTLVAPRLRELPAPEITAEQVTTGARTGETFTVGSIGADLRYRVLAYVDRGAQAVIALALPIDSVDDAVSRLMAVQLLGAAAILATLGLVAWWVIHLGVRPLGRMTEVAASIAGGDLSQRVPEGQPETEAGQLGVALNRMLEQIEGAFEERSAAESRLRQFVADASHELRTPVTTIRGYAELYRTGGLAEGAELADAMRRTEQEVVRMGALIDDLLQLARLDEGRPLESAPVDLMSMAEDTAADARAVEPGRPVAVSGESLVVAGDERAIRQVLANVMGNARVHTPADTPVAVTVTREADRAVITITDEGPGMSSEAAARAFERFYRADPARARQRGGSGLGLSIVRATVEALGGQVTLRSAPGEGTSVRIELPPHDPSTG